MPSFLEDVGNEAKRQVNNSGISNPRGPDPFYGGVMGEKLTGASPRDFYNWYRERMDRSDIGNTLYNVFSWSPIDEAIGAKPRSYYVEKEKMEKLGKIEARRKERLQTSRAVGGGFGGGGAGYAMAGAGYADTLARFYQAQMEAQARAKQQRDASGAQMMQLLALAYGAGG